MVTKTTEDVNALGRFLPMEEVLEAMNKAMADYSDDIDKAIENTPKNERGLKGYIDLDPANKRLNEREIICGLTLEDLGRVGYYYGINGDARYRGERIVRDLMEKGKING